MTSLFVLDVVDFRPLAVAASKDPAVSVRRRGPYLELRAAGPLKVNRDETGCRNAVWFSSVAAVRDGRVSRWDRHVLEIEPHVAAEDESR